MAKLGPKLIKQYPDEFKLKAVAMSNQPASSSKTSLPSLYIHLFMLSRWSKEVRDGVSTGQY